MNFFTSHRSLLSLLALSLLLFTTTCSAKLLRVTVFNGRLRTAAMTVHCKSKINDFGPRKLKPAEEFQFEAEASTLYSCGFWLNEESHSFDIYKPSRDKCATLGCNDNYFFWVLKQDGPCFMRWVNHDYQEICYPWD